MCVFYKYRYNSKEFQNELGLNLYDYGARNYDAALGRYFSMDNFSEAFYNLNTYQYTANNPVKFIDMNGDYIYIYDGSGKGYRYDKGKLYSREKEGDEWEETQAEEGSYVAQIVGSLNSISNGDENSFGSILLNLFSNDKINAYITDNEFTDDIKKNRTTTSGLKIRTAFDQNEKVRTTSGNQNLIFHISLAHELAHVFANQVFDLDILSKEWYSIMDSNGKRHKLNQSEVFASFIENFVRSEQHLPLRLYYSVDTDGSVVQDSRLIKKSKSQGFITQYESTERALEIWTEILNSRKQ
ncbi:RHS repeat-associated core domain-containing protein [Flavobacterium sp. HNIBRBA15423]|uniref:RHS repeat-associated core domain-containing protein n=1 Tax=Flavobacterium sp. HNIBRBA15423 TaxID=3458683 RepID=UPI004044BF1A